MFADHPVAGMGANTFTNAAESLLGKRHAAHNIWVQTAAETGIIGLVLLFTTLVTAFLPAVKWRDFRLGFHVVLFLVLMTASFVANLIDDKGVWIGLAILSATAALPARQRVAEPSHEEVDTSTPVMESG